MTFEQQIPRELVEMARTHEMDIEKHYVIISSHCYMRAIHEMRDLAAHEEVFGYANLSPSLKPLCAQPKYDRGAGTGLKRFRRGDELTKMFKQYGKEYYESCNSPNFPPFEQWAADKNLDLMIKDLDKPVRFGGDPEKLDDRMQEVFPAIEKGYIGQVVVRPLTMEETIVECMEFYHSWTNGTQPKPGAGLSLLREGLTTCTGIAYNGEGKAKIAPLCRELIEMKNQGLNYLMDRDAERLGVLNLDRLGAPFLAKYDTFDGVEIDLRRCKTDQGMSRQEVMEHPAWRAVVQDRYVLQEFTDLIHSIKTAPNGKPIREYMRFETNDSHKEKGDPADNLIRQFGHCDWRVRKFIEHGLAKKAEEPRGSKEWLLPMSLQYLYAGLWLGGGLESASRIRLLGISAIVDWEIPYSQGIDFSE